MITKVAYSNIKYGATIGVFAYHFFVNGDLPEKDSLPRILELLEKEPPGRNKIAVLDGVYGSFQNEYLLSLVMGLKNQGFKIQVATYGVNYYFPWFSQVDRIVYHASDREEALTFDVDEFIFHIYGEQIRKIPLIPRGKPNTVYEIDPLKIPKEDLLYFLDTSPIGWKILPYSFIDYGMTIYEIQGEAKGEKDEQLELSFNFEPNTGSSRGSRGEGSFTSADEEDSLPEETPSWSEGKPNGDASDTGEAGSRKDKGED